MPPGPDAILRAAQIVDLHAKLWYGDLNDPAIERGIKSSRDTTGSQGLCLLQRTADDHQQLLDRGSCCCSAHQHARTTSFALSIPRLPSYSPGMTPASRQCFSSLLGQLPHRPSGKSAASLCAWEVSGALCALPTRQIGRAGPTACQ